MIKLIDILNEYNVNKPVKYKYRIGQTVRELDGDEEACQILDRRPNWVAVEANPVNTKYAEFYMQHDNEVDNEPWYLVQWLEHNAEEEPTWWNESELQPYNKIDEQLSESVITNVDPKTNTISIDGYDNVEYKTMPNTKFIELKIDKSPQYRLQHYDVLDYYPNDSPASQAYKESTLNRIVKHLRDNNIKAIIVDGNILMANVISVSENLNEYVVNKPDAGYKIADWIYKYFTEDPYEVDWDKAEYDLGHESDEVNAISILYHNMNIFERNTVTRGDIERWRNAPHSNLKDNTVDEILEYLLGMVLIKKAQPLNEYEIKKPTPSLPSDFINEIKDAINRYIVGLVEEYSYFTPNPAIDFVKGESQIHDTIVDFIKEHMVVNHYEYEKDGKEIIASPLNVQTINEEEVLDYLEANTDLERYLNKVIWKAYFEAIDIEEIRKKVFNYIRTKEHPDIPHTRHTQEWYDTYIPLLIEKVVGYYLDPTEVFEENDFIQTVNDILRKSDFINEYTINKPARQTYKISDWVKYEYGSRDYDYVRLEYNEDVADACMILDDIVDLNNAETVNTNEIEDWLKNRVKDNAVMWDGDTDSLVDFFLKTDVIRKSSKINEYTINKPNSANYRISWYEGPDQYNQEKVNTTLSNVEKIAINKLKSQYQYRRGYEYWASIEQNLGDEIIPRYKSIMHVTLDPELDGLYVTIKMYDEDKAKFIDTKTFKI